MMCCFYFLVYRRRYKDGEKEKELTPYEKWMINYGNGSEDRQAGEGPVMFANSTHNPVLDTDSKHAKVYHRKTETQELHESGQKKSAVLEQARRQRVEKAGMAAGAGAGAGAAVGSETLGDSAHPEQPGDDDGFDPEDFETEDNVNPMYAKEGEVHVGTVGPRTVNMSQQSTGARDGMSLYADANNDGGYYDENNNWRNGLFGEDGTFYPGYFDENHQWVDLEEPETNSARISYKDYGVDDSNKEFAYSNPMSSSESETARAGEYYAEDYPQGTAGAGEYYAEEQGSAAYYGDESCGERGSHMTALEAGSTHNPMTDNQVDPEQARDGADAAV
jgi:hypothetical protein